VVKIDLVGGDEFAEVVDAEIDVFGVWMLVSGRGEVNGAHVVVAKDGRAGGKVVEVLEEAAEEDEMGGRH
jgi:hypothetical protein